MERPMIGKHVTRRTVVAAGATGALAGLAAPFVRPARAAAQVIRYATGGGIGPNEMETIIYLDWMQKNVLKGYGKDYTVDMTFTRGTPEAGNAARCGAGRHGDAVVRRVRHLGAQEHRARRHEHRLGQLSGRSAWLRPKH